MTRLASADRRQKGFKREASVPRAWGGPGIYQTDTPRPLFRRLTWHQRKQHQHGKTQAGGEFAGGQWPSRISPLRSKGSFDQLKTLLSVASNKTGRHTER